MQCSFFSCLQLCASLPHLGELVAPEADLAAPVPVDAAVALVARGVVVVAVLQVAVLRAQAARRLELRRAEVGANHTRIGCKSTPKIIGWKRSFASQTEGNISRNGKTEPTRLSESPRPGNKKIMCRRYTTTEEIEVINQTKS